MDAYQTSRARFPRGNRTNVTPLYLQDIVYTEFVDNGEIFAPV
jgi:hypothetical protein